MLSLELLLYGYVAEVVEYFKNTMLSLEHTATAKDWGVSIWISKTPC